MSEEGAEKPSTSTSALHWTRSAWFLSAAFAGAYFVAGRVGGHLSPRGTTYVSFWLPAGVYFAALLLTERRRWPAVLLGALVGNAAFDSLIGTPPAVILLFYLANTVQAVGGAWLVQRFIAHRPSLDDLRQFFGVVGMSLIGTALGAAVGTATLVAYGYSSSFFASWRVWWGSCSMAVLLCAPFALVWFRLRATSSEALRLRKRWWEFVLLCVGIVAGAWWVLVVNGGILSNDKLQLFPILIWAGVRFGLPGATLANLMLALLTAGLTTYYQVGLTAEAVALGSYVFTLQTFLTVASLVTLIPAIAIGARNRTLQELEDSQERLRQFSAATFEGICFSENGIVVDGNEQALRMFNCSREEFIGRPILEFIAPEARDKVSQAVKEHREVLYEHQLLRKDGSVFYGEAQARIVRVGGRTLRMTALRDITERRRAEAEIAMREAVLRQFVKHAPAAIAIMDTDMRYLQASDRWLADYHLDMPNIIGKSHYEVFPDVPERWKQIHQRVLKGAVESCEEDPFPRADGTFEWLQWEARPWQRGDGEIAGLIFFTQVITERKRVEAARLRAEESRRELEVQLRQAQKMEAIGTLAGGIAHDFNNILGSIVALTELGRLDNPENQDLQDNLGQVLQASRRAASLVQQILTFSRRQPQERRAVLLAPIVIEALKLLRATLPTTITLQEELEPNLPPVIADVTQIHQIVVNLGTNAGHAMRGAQGALSIKLSRVRLAEPTPELAVPPGDYLHLTVRDTGHGMSEEIRQRIFEPFFTTKAPGDGTGLGLSVVHGIVLEHGGAIAVESESGVGTVFHVYLPVADSEVAADVQALAPAPLGQGQRILLVDDERFLADATSKLLSRNGYRTVVFNNPAQAWQVFSAGPDEFDLVITDLTMPHLTGTELAALVLTLRPQLPIILTTGSRNDLTDEAAARVGIREVIIKPLDYSALLHTIERCLRA